MLFYLEKGTHTVDHLGLDDGQVLAERTLADNHGLQHCHHLVGLHQSDQRLRECVGREVTGQVIGYPSSLNCG